MTELNDLKLPIATEVIRPTRTEYGVLFKVGKQTLTINTQPGQLTLHKDQVSSAMLGTSGFVLTLVLRS